MKIDKLKHRLFQELCQKGQNDHVLEGQIE